MRRYIVLGRGPFRTICLETGCLKSCASIAPADGRFEISAERLSAAEPLWRTKLDLFVDEVQGCVIHAGQFLAADHAAIAVSVTDERLVREGTYLIDGRNGQVKWFKSRYRNGTTIMPYRPRGVPTAVDFDGDGVEEIGMDMLSYMAYLRGSDGEFVYVAAHKEYPHRGCRLLRPPVQHILSDLRERPRKTSALDGDRRIRPVWTDEA